jgi:hypothetical protein
MQNTKPAHVFLPSWRDGRLLFFTDVLEGFAARLEYRVAAATLAGETQVRPSGKVDISADTLALCQATADSGAALQPFFRVMGSGNLGHLVSEGARVLPPCAKGVSPFFYISSYHNFLRKYMGDQMQVQAYEAAPVATRVHPEGTRAIYKILSAHLQPARALALIEADIPALETMEGRPATMAKLWGEVAEIQGDSGDLLGAMATLGKAARHNNTEDIWRRRAAMAIRAQAPEKAIAYFDKADSLFPLAPPAALEMARLLVETGRFGRAEPYLMRAASTHPKPVEQLRKTIAKANETSR